MFYCLNIWDFPKPGGPGPCIYIPQEQRSPVIVKVKVILWPTVSRPVHPGVRRPTGTRDQFFPFSLWLFVRQFRVCCCVPPSLTRSRVCTFQFLPGIANADFLRSESHGTHGQFIVSILETPPTWRARFLNLFPPGTGWPSYNPRALCCPAIVKVKVTLRPTVSRPVRLGVRRPSGTRGKFFNLLEIFF
jgi:hypothetical protein